MSNSKKITPARRRYYTLLRVAKTGLQMADESYHELLSRHGATMKDGKISASTMAFGGLVSALEEMKSKGFKVKPKSAASRAAPFKQKQIKKIIALWCALADAGVVHSREESSMRKWCMRLTKTQRLEWAESDKLSKCIEALKDWAAREKIRPDARPHRFN